PPPTRVATPTPTTEAAAARARGMPEARAGLRRPLRERWSCARPGDPGPAVPRCGSGALRRLLAVAVVDLHDAGGGAAVDPARLAGAEHGECDERAIGLELQLAARLDRADPKSLEILGRHEPQARLLGSGPELQPIALGGRPLVGDADRFVEGAVVEDHDGRRVGEALEVGEGRGAH